MAQTLQEWLSTEVKQLQKMPVGELSNTFFFRDPIRPNYIDHEHFYHQLMELFYTKSLLRILLNL
jgi:phosphatidylserine decarboxylase